MAILGMTFEQAASVFGWGELVNFSEHLPLDSAVNRAKNAKYYGFSSDFNRAVILADIFDAVRSFNYTFAKGGSKEPPRYPRPWETGDKQRIGSGAIPISEFDKWYYGGDA